MRLDKEIKKQIKEYALKLEQEKREKELLLSSKSDFGLLEKLVQKSNENPNLKIEVFLNDGTRILLRTFEERKRIDSELINGDYYEVR